MGCIGIYAKVAWETINGPMDNIPSFYMWSYGLNKYYNQQDPSTYSGYTRVMMLTKDKKNINSMSMVVKAINKIYDSERFDVWAVSNLTPVSGYSGEVNRAFSALLDGAYKAYLPDGIKIPKFRVKTTDDVSAYGGDFGINVSIHDIDLNEPFDYYVHLHELSHFLDAHSSNFNILAFQEGYATTLAEDALKLLDMSYDFKQNFSGLNLTDAQLNNYETYFMDIDGWDAYKAGYSFLRYLQDKFGADVVKRIAKTRIERKENQWLMLNGTEKEQKQKLIDAIKKETSDTVFIDYKDWYDKNR